MFRYPFSISNWLDGLTMPEDTNTFQNRNYPNRKLSWLPDGPPLQYSITKILPEYHWWNLLSANGKKMHIQLKKIRSTLLNRRGWILLHENPRAHVGRMTLQKLTNLWHQNSPYTSYFLWSVTHWLQHFEVSWQYLSQKTLRGKEKSETAVKDFLASKRTEFIF